MTRRDLLRNAIYAGCLYPVTSAKAFDGLGTEALAQVDYSQVQLAPGRLLRQFKENHQLVLSLSEESMLRPFRVREDLPAPGAELGGWYSTYAFAPGATYGQWLSALARYYAVTGDEGTREKVQRLVAGYAATIDPAGKFFINNRFPSYTYDKLVCGLIDALAYTKDPLAMETLTRTTDAAWRHLPEKAFARQETEVLANEDFTRHCWDESYTLPENLFIAFQRTGNSRYRDLAKRLLYDGEFFDPLSRGENVLPGKHAYSHVNSLSSAAQAYLVLGEQKYLRAAKNGFAMVQEQSYVTGGWGPDEHFFVPGSGKLGESLKSTHSSFETPCGSYAHFKIARYLLRVTKDSRYGDSMERVMYNTVLGAKPIQANGSAFYYADYNFSGSKFFHPDKWPCCSGTLPQVAADYGINSYFQSPSGLYVNLYVPSTIAWEQAGARCTLRQATEYPYDSSIRFDVTASTPGTFCLFFRIPEWARGASIAVNGTRDSRKAVPGTFAELRKQWKTGDRVELDLPLRMRLEAVDAQHPDTKALLAGPLVLMGLLKGRDIAPLSEASLLSARRLPGESHIWTADPGHNALKLTPFMDIRDEHYSTYLKVSES